MKYDFSNHIYNPDTKNALSKTELVYIQGVSGKAGIDSKAFAPKLSALSMDTKFPKDDREFLGGLIGEGFVLSDTIPTKKYHLVTRNGEFIDPTVPCIVQYFEDSKKWESKADEHNVLDNYIIDVSDSEDGGDTGDGVDGEHEKASNPPTQNNNIGSQISLERKTLEAVKQELKTNDVFFNAFARARYFLPDLFSNESTGKKEFNSFDELISKLTELGVQKEQRVQCLQNKFFTDSFAGFVKEHSKNVKLLKTHRVGDVSMNTFFNLWRKWAVGFSELCESFEDMPLVALAMSLEKDKRYDLENQPGFKKSGLNSTFSKFVGEDGFEIPSFVVVNHCLEDCQDVFINILSSAEKIGFIIQNTTHKLAIKSGINAILRILRSLVKPLFKKTKRSKKTWAKREVIETNRALSKTGLFKVKGLNNEIIPYTSKFKAVNSENFTDTKSQSVKIEKRAEKLTSHLVKTGKIPMTESNQKMLEIKDRIQKKKEDELVPPSSFGVKYDISSKYDKLSLAISTGKADKATMMEIRTAFYATNPEGGIVDLIITMEFRQSGLTTMTDRTLIKAAKVSFDKAVSDLSGQIVGFITNKRTQGQMGLEAVLLKIASAELGLRNLKIPNLGTDGQGKGMFKDVLQASREFALIK